MQRNFEPMRKQVETWQRSELTDVTAKVVIYEAFVPGAPESGGRVWCVGGKREPDPLATGISGGEPSAQKMVFLPFAQVRFILGVDGGTPSLHKGSGWRAGAGAPENGH